MNKVKGKLFALDFDGTIIDGDMFPNFDDPKPNAIHTMKRIINEGGKIAIWTCRSGAFHIEGIRSLLNYHGLHDFIINEHFPEMLEKYDDCSPKIFADVYIDDRSLHAEKIDWYEIEQMIFGDNK